MAEILRSACLLWVNRVGFAMFALRLLCPQHQTFVLYSILQSGANAPGTGQERTWHWTRMRRWVGQSSVSHIRRGAPPMRSGVRPGQQGDEAYHASQYGWPPAFGVSHNTTRTNAPVTRYGAARFLSERRGRLTRFAVNYLVGRTAEAAGFPDLHPHCLRHSCGYALADRGVDLRTIQEWLGHRSIEMTVRYTRISASV
jgi:Phage integrase family